MKFKNLSFTELNTLGIQLVLAFTFHTNARTASRAGHSFRQQFKSAT